MCGDYSFALARHINSYTLLLWKYNQYGTIITVKIVSKRIKL